jgi:hypothetical protein
MKRIVLCSVALAATFAVTTSILGSHAAPTDRSVPPNMMVLEEVQARVDVNKLAINEFEDLSLVYSSPAAH